MPTFLLSHHAMTYVNQYVSQHTCFNNLQCGGRVRGVHTLFVCEFHCVWGDARLSDWYWHIQFALC